MSKLNSVVSKILASGLKVTLVPRLIGLCGALQIRRWRAAFVALDPDLAASPDLEIQPLGQGINDGNTDTMKSTGNLVGVVIEFAAGMKFRQDDFGGSLPLLRHDLRGNAATVVGDGDRPVDVDADMNFGAVPRERFVDGVVDNFVDQVVKSIDARRADVHRRALTNSLKSFKNLDLIGTIAGFAGWLQQSCQTLQNRVFLPLIFCLVRFDRNVQRN